MTDKIGRNDLCHCGSGKKYKKCCMTKDKEEKETFLQKMKNVTVSAGLSGHDKYIFNSKEEILESIRAEGFEPVAHEWVNEFFVDPDSEKTESVTHLTVDLYCEHGHSEIGREYILRDTGKWEFESEGYDMPCPECVHKSKTS